MYACRLLLLNTPWAFIWQWNFETREIISRIVIPRGIGESHFCSAFWSSALDLTWHDTLATWRLCQITRQNKIPSLSTLPNSLYGLISFVESMYVHVGSMMSSKRSCVTTPLRRDPPCHARIRHWYLYIHRTRTLSSSTLTLVVKLACSSAIGSH